MSHHKTILAHLVGWACSNRHEDAATEGFAYVLSRHAVVRRRFVEVLRAIDARLPDDLRFTTQQAAGAGRADMAGRSGEALRVIVENKFTAGLTVNQPNGYLAALAATSGATVLVFIAPPNRRDTLWQELIDRVGPERQQTAIRPYCVEITGANGTTRLALLDWRSRRGRCRTRATIGGCSACTSSRTTSMGRASTTTTVTACATRYARRVRSCRPAASRAGEWASVAPASPQ